MTGDFSPARNTRQVARSLRCFCPIGGDACLTRRARTIALLLKQGRAGMALTLDCGFADAVVEEIGHVGWAP